LIVKHGRVELNSCFSCHLDIITFASRHSRVVSDNLATTERLRDRCCLCWP